jgi:rhodanese-related sulfurtransferase
MIHSAAFLKLVEEAKKKIRETNVEAIKGRLSQGEKFHLIDVREGNEWRNGHVPGAIHLARGIIERDIEKTIPDTGAEIVLYCGGGFRSALVAESLQKMGYRNVASMDGGWRGWVEAKGPVED